MAANGVKSLQKQISQAKESREKIPPFAFRKAETTAEWVFGSQKTELTQWLKEYHDNHTLETQVGSLRSSETSIVRADRSKSSNGSSYPDTSSDVSVLNPDFLQALEDVLLEEPPNDLRPNISHLFNHTEVGPVEGTCYSREGLVQSIANSFAVSADILDSSIKQSLPEHHMLDSTEREYRIGLRDFLRDATHLPSQDSHASQLNSLYLIILESLMLFRSAPKQKRNQHIIENFLQESSIRVHHMYHSIRRWTPLSTTPVRSVESILVTSGLLFYTGLLAFSRFNLKTDKPQVRSYVEIARNLFLLDLSYGTNRWASWYRLGQCYEVLATGPPADQSQTTRAIRCYIQAIASSQHIDHPVEASTSVASLYYDLGVSICCSDPSIEFGWDLDRSGALRMAISLFGGAIKIHEKHTESYFMLTVSAYQLLDTSNDYALASSNEPSSTVSDAYWKFLNLSRDSGFYCDWGYRYDLFQELVSLFKWLASSKIIELQDVLMMANQTVAVVLEQREGFGPHNRYLRDWQPGENDARFFTILPAEVQIRNKSTHEVPHKKSQIDPSWERTERTAVDTGRLNPLNRSPTEDTALDSTIKANRPKKRRLWPSANIQSGSGTKIRSKLGATLVDERSPISELEPKELIRLAILHEKQQNITSSMKYFNQLMHPQKGYADKETWWLKIAPLLEKAGKAGLATKMYKMVLEKNSESAEALQHLGRIYHEENESHENQERAIGYLERAVVFDKTNANTWHQLGLSYISRGYLFKAHEALKHALHRDRQHVDCWLSLGTLNMKMKLYDEAQHAFDTAIGLDQKKVDSWIHLGSLMQQMGAVSKAIDSFKKATDLDPSNSTARKHLTGLISANNGQAPSKESVE